jgi:hypothetical protein
VSFHSVLRATRIARALGRNCAGNVAISFAALSALPLLLVCGLAMDFSAGFLLKNQASGRRRCDGVGACKPAHGYAGAVAGFGAINARFDGRRRSRGAPYPLVTPYADDEQSPALDELTREACANARAAGIQVYAIGFQATDVISASAQQLFEDCAGDDSTHFFLVSDETSLAQVFSSIRPGTSNTRLVQ